MLDTQNNQLFSARTLTVYLGFELNALEIFNLRSVFHRISRTFNLENICNPIVSFFGKIKKGSKKIRNILLNDYASIKINTGLVKRGILANTAHIDEIRDCNFNNTFNSPKISHTLKSFIFNFSSQILYNNSMIAHFVQDFSPTCKRCEYARLLPAPKETLLHIFWDCPCIQEITSDVKTLISNEPITNNRFREILFLGSASNLKYNIKKTNLICMAALFFIFSTRNKNATYNINKLYEFLNFHTNNLLSFIN